MVKMIDTDWWLLVVNTCSYQALQRMIGLWTCGICTALFPREKIPPVDTTGPHEANQRERDGDPEEKRRCSRKSLKCRWHLDSGMLRIIKPAGGAAVKYPSTVLALQSACRFGCRLWFHERSVVQPANFCTVSLSILVSPNDCNPVLTTGETHFLRDP